MTATENITNNADYAGAENFILEQLQKLLSPRLKYHGAHHTADVMDAAMRIAQYEEIDEETTRLLRVAVAYHDSGFIKEYQGHEAISCENARLTLPGFGFDENQISVICSMIMATKIPQLPHTLPEKIICDADLDYLGRNDVYEVAATLYDELKLYYFITDETGWNKMQINFLKTHHYFTNYARVYRNASKEKYLNELLASSNR